MTKKTIPTFSQDTEEAQFWEKTDSADYIDWDKAAIASFPALKPTTRSISLRVPEHLLNSLKIMANKRDVPYQSLMKMFLEDKVREEQRLSSSAPTPHA